MKRILFTTGVCAFAIAAAATIDTVRADVASAAGGSSDVCFNEGLYAKGALVDYDTKITGGDDAGTYRAINTTQAKAKFKGVSSIPVEVEAFNAKGKSQGVVTGYFVIDKDFLLMLGSKAKGFESTFDPASRQPIDQAKGDTFKQKYKMTTVSGEITQTISRQASWKFAGFEDLKTAVGKFKVCKITAKFTDTFGTFSTVTNQTIYIAAEGKYRGFPLRTKTSGAAATGQPINATADVVKFRKFQPQ